MCKNDYQDSDKSDDADEKKDSHGSAQHQGQGYRGAVEQGGPAAVLGRVVTEDEDVTQFLFRKKN